MHRLGILLLAVVGGEKEAARGLVPEMLDGGLLKRDGMLEELDRSFLEFLDRGEDPLQIVAILRQARPAKLFWRSARL